MEIEKKESEKDKKEKYSQESIKNPDYQDLFEEITKCAERTWNNEFNGNIGRKKTKIIKHPKFAEYLVLDFNHLYDFLLELAIKKGKSKKEFKNAIDGSAIEWNTFYRGQKRFVDSSKINIGICAIAELTRTPLISLMAQFLDDCEKEHKKIRLFSYLQYEEIIQSLLKEELHLTGELEEKSLISTREKYIVLDIEANGFCISKNIADGVYSIEHGRGEKHLAIPQEQFHDIEEIAKFLDWQQHLSPFIGRKNELESLRQWLESEHSPKSIMLLYGEGGVGKTRLAFHFVKQVQAQGWEAGRTTTDNFVGNWYSGQKGLLLVIDYIEERTDEVVGLLRAVRNFDESCKKGINLRILLLSRNPHFIKTVAARASIKHIEKIFLKQLYDDEESWSIFEGSWRRLEELKIKYQSLSIDPQPSFPDKFEFLKWHETDPMHKVPIFIVALAIYLFNENCNTNKPIVELRSGEIIRYLSEREERLIRNEVEKYNKDNSASDTIEVEGVLLLKAVAAISNGLDSQQINALTRRLDFNRINYSPPKVSGLSRLSLWVDNKIQALQPDILASDFLAYSLEKWAKNHEGHWIFAAAGEPDIESGIE